MKKKITIGLFAFLMLISGFYGYRYFIDEPVVMEIHGMYGFNVGSENDMMLHSTDVFIGRVTENKGTIKPFGTENTLYSVDVITNIKGETPKHIDVRQLAGYEFNPINATKYWYGMDGELPYEEGDLYLFFTNNKNDIEYYTAHAGVGAVPIENQNPQKELIDTYKKAEKQNKEENRERVKYRN